MVPWLGEGILISQGAKEWILKVWIITFLSYNFFIEKFLFDDVKLTSQTLI